MQKGPAGCPAGPLKRVIENSLEFHTHIYRPAGAGMMEPVMVQRDKHVRLDYRRPAGVVNLAGTEALESAVRLSFTP